MSGVGQKAKYSLRAHIVRFAPESGLKSDLAGGPFRAKLRHGDFKKPLKEKPPEGGFSIQT
jgi:hypothetical protein